MSCEPDQPCTCDDDLCEARVAAVHADDSLLIRSADGQVHSVPIETR